MKILTFLMLLPFFCWTQKQDKLSFELGLGKNTFAMTNLNKYYIDSFAVKNQLLDKGINSGNQFFGGLKYRPNSMFDFGVYGNYQVVSSKGGFSMIETDNMGAQIGIIEYLFILKTQSIGIGISNCWYISHFLKFHNKNNSFLKRSHIGLEWSAGVGFSEVSFDTRDPSSTYGSSFNFFSSRDFQGQIGIKFEYDFIKSPIISSIGIKGGFQYHRTKTMKDRNGYDWIVLGNHQINLDFSGFYGSIYFSIGK